MSTTGPNHVGTHDRPDGLSLDGLLAGRESHVWYVAPEQVTNASLLAAYRTLLSASERERNARYVFERDRRADLITRALIRTTLSRYYPAVPPAAWAFTPGPFGKPSIVRPPGCPDLQFSISHTDGLVVCLVGVGRDVGVDVENTARSSDIDEVTIAARYFSPSEARAVRSASRTERPDRFFGIWTLKEAYVKARGLGLQLPLDRFSVSIGGVTAGVGDASIDVAQSAAIAFGPEIEDDPHHWQLQLYRPTPRHRLAVAISRPGEPDLTVQLFSTGLLPCEIHR